MPFLLIKTNIDLEKTVYTALLHHATRVVAQSVGKPESYVMVNVCGKEYMSFGGTTTPTVYMELKSVDLPDEYIPGISAALTEMIETKIKVPGTRIYIEFSSSPGHRWGFNGTTF